jgi:nitroreductase
MRDAAVAQTGVENGAKRLWARFGVLPILAERWSPRSFSDRPPDIEKLRSMFEAARMAPSAHNSQPARFLLTRKGVGDGFQRLFECLSKGNKEWAHTAPVLLLGTAARRRFSQADSATVPYPHFMHDLGLAVMSLILQAQAVGLWCHPMAGFEPELAREAFSIPELFEPGIVIAVGYLGSPDALSESLRRRELAPRTRRPLEEMVFEQEWGHPTTLFAGHDLRDKEDRP